MDTATNTNASTSTSAPATTSQVNLDVTLSEDRVKALVNEFLTKNSKLEWSQKTAGYSLAYLLVQAGIVEETMFKAAAKFLTQDSLHGLSGNASQYRQWHFGKNDAKKKVEIEELTLD